MVDGHIYHCIFELFTLSPYYADPSLMFQASLSNGRLLLRVAQPSVTALLEANRPIVALATLMYAPGTLSQVSMYGTQGGPEKLFRKSFVIKTQGHILRGGE